MKERDIRAIAKHLQEPKCKIKRLFIDWDPLWGTLDKSGLEAFSELGKCKGLDSLLIRGCGITDDIFIKLIENLKETDVQLEVLDLYANKITDKGIHFLGNFIQGYKNIKAFGFGANCIQDLDCFKDFFAKVGKIEITSDEYDSLVQEHKRREKIMEKNEKLRSLKKQEEQVPYVDPISFDSATKKYYKTSYSNLKYLNLTGNRMKSSNPQFVIKFLERVPEITLVLAVNNFEDDFIEEMQRKETQVYI